MPPISVIDFRCTVDVIAARVCLIGDLDSSTRGHLLDMIEPLRRTRTVKVSIDLHGVTFIDAAGLGGFVRVRNLLTEQHTALELMNAPPRIARTFGLGNLASLLDPSSRCV